MLTSAIKINNGLAGGNVSLAHVAESFLERVIAFWPESFLKSRKARTSFLVKRIFRKLVYHFALSRLEAQRAFCVRAVSETRLRSL